jgi:hypothetical protein
MIYVCLVVVFAYLLLLIYGLLRRIERLEETNRRDYR